MEKRFQVLAGEKACQRSKTHRQIRLRRHSYGCFFPLANAISNNGQTTWNETRQTLPCIVWRDPHCGNSVSRHRIRYLQSTACLRFGWIRLFGFFLKSNSEILITRRQQKQCYLRWQLEQLICFPKTFGLIAILR